MNIVVFLFNYLILNYKNDSNRTIPEKTDSTIISYIIASYVILVAPIDAMAFYLLIMF
jgi:hypothetical protein